MDLYFNNVSPTGIRWNNNVVTEVQYNNVKIWPSTSYYDPADYDLTQATYMVKSNNANVPFNIGNDCSPYDIYEVKLQWKPNTQSYHGACLFGCASPSRFALFRELTAYFDYGGNGRRTVTTGSYNSSTIYTYRIWCDSDNVGHIKNVDTDEQDTDTGWACNHSPQNMSSALSLSIFYATDSGTIYYVKVYADDGVTLKHWWVPCSNNTTGYLCWFDLVTANITNYQNNSGLYTDSSIVLSASSTTTNQLAGSFNISVEGLVTSVTSDAAWLTYTNSGDNYTISATRQTTNSARSGHITFSNSISTATFTYTQNFDASISCTNVSTIQTASTETITVTTVEPVVSITLDSDAQQFITLVTQTLDTSTFTIDIAAYTGTTSRSGTITFNNGYNNAVSTITQTYVAAGCNIECVYNVTSTSSATTILYTTTNVSMIEVNGVPYSPSTSFTFSSTGLQTVKFTTSSSIIPEFMFRNVSALQSCTIYASITTLGHDMFRSSGVVTVTLPEGLTSIGDEVFHDATHMTTFNIPSTVTSLGDGCFNNCDGLTNVVIPDTVTTLGDGCFCWCDNMQSMTISKNATKIPFLFLYGSTCPSITCMATTAPSLASGAFQNFQSRNGILYVPTGSDYSSWISAMPSGWTVSYINPS